MLYNLKIIKSNIHLTIACILAQGKWSRLFAILISVLFLMVCATIVLFFTYGGFCLVGKDVEYGTNPYEPTNVIDAAYYLLFTNGGQNLYYGSHWLGIVITTISIIFIAVLTSMITNFFERIGQNYLSGESTFSMKKHIVIIGTSDVLYSILKSKKKNTKNKFLILTSRDVIQERRKILSFLNKKDSGNIVFMYGDRTSEKDINRLSLAYAKEVYVIGDSEENDSIESYRDSNNMDCVEIIAKNPDVKKLRKGNNKLPCHVMFEFQTTFVAFQFSEMGETYKDHIDFMPFNFYDMWAQKVIVAGGKDCSGVQKYKFLDTLSDGYINKDSKESVHLIIIGITKMGVAMGIQVAQVCHFPNFIADHSKRTRITFIDAEADVEFNYLNGRYNDLFNIARHRIVDLSLDDKELKNSWKNDDSWLDVEWEFIKGRAESPVIQEYIKNSCEDQSHIVTLAVCLNRSHKSMATAMFLPESVFSKCLQILVYQRLSGTIVNNVATPVNAKETEYRYKNIRPFGMIDCGYDPLFEEVIFNWAKCISYVYDSYYRTTQEGDQIKEVKEWDEKLEKYDNAFSSWGQYTNYEDYWVKKKKVWERISCQFNALSLNTKLRSIGVEIHDGNSFQLDTVVNRIDCEIDNLQMVEHNRWNMEKLLTGYRALTDEERNKLHDYWDIWNNPQSAEVDRKKAKNAWSHMRKQLKEWPKRAHLDICSFEVLKTCEEETILTHDIKLNKAIPFIFERNRKKEKGCCESNIVFKILRLMSRKDSVSKGNKVSYD